MNNAPKVIVGMSGGVDSSVAAYLLLEQGYRVEAMFMQNWHDTEGTLHGDCEWEEDQSVARMVCKKLNIPFHFIDLSTEYRKRVVDYMFSEYEKGRTPNPDVLCNREIKFDVFLEACLQLGGDFVATGHYCRKAETIVDGKPVYRLLAGTDGNKDQSYFLCQLNQQQLSKAMFPIGDMEKPEVRRIAAEQHLPTAERKDSQGICFVGKVDLPVFLQQKISAKDGPIVEIFPSFFPSMASWDEAKKALNNATGLDRLALLKDLAQDFAYKISDGKTIGNHRGAHFYTIGQRKGLNVGGHIEPLFVIKTDTLENVVYVGEGHQHPGLNRPALFIPTDEIHWIRPDMQMKVGEARDYLVRIRYRQALQKAKLYREADGMYIVFDELQRGITSGQFAAWYSDQELLGSGVIF